MKNINTVLEKEYGKEMQESQHVQYEDILISKCYQSLPDLIPCEEMGRSFRDESIEQNQERNPSS